MKRQSVERRHSPALMIAALLLSFAFWAYAQSARSNQTPVSNRRIDVRGLASDLVVYPSDLPSINIELMGAFEDLRRIDTMKVVPFIDLSNVKPGTTRVAVQLDRRAIPLGVEYDIRRPYVDVTIERKVSAKRTVLVETTGEPPEGYTVQSVEAMPRRIEITGAKSEVERVVAARIIFDLAQAREEEPSATIELIDANGRIVEASEHLRPDLTEVRIKAVVVPSAPKGPRP